MQALRNLVIEVEVVGTDGFRIADSYPLAAISRDVEDLVAQAVNADHQYPDGLVLFLGTMFAPLQRSEEHTSELQSLMRISYAVFCLKKKKTNTTQSLKGYTSTKPTQPKTEKN